MLKLRFKNNKQNAVWLVEPKVTIGRKFTNDLIIEDPQACDLHAEILVKHENLTLVNLVGGNNVLINNQIVESAAPLNINDEVRVGGIILEVVDPKLEARPAARNPEPSQTTGWALKAQSAALGNRVFPLKARTVVGRSNDCDITLAASHLSRRHVELLVSEGFLYAKDLGSANGTYLNGERISEPRVKRGDELRFDTLSFGVIGPSEDLDKTTIRSAAEIEAALATPAAQFKSANSATVKAAPSRPMLQDKTSVQTTSRSSANPGKHKRRPVDSKNANGATSINTKPNNSLTPSASAHSASKAGAHSSRPDADVVQSEKSKARYVVALVLVLIVGLGLAYHQGLLASLL